MSGLPPDICPRLQAALESSGVGLDDSLALLEHATAQRFAGVSVYPPFVSAVARRGAGRISIVSRVGQFGLSKPTIKAIEATSAIKDGANEIEIEPLLAPQLQGDHDATRHELLEIVRAARATGRDVILLATIRSRVLLDVAGEPAIESACRAIRQGACDGIVDIGDDASHTVVRTHAEGLLVRRRMPHADTESIRLALSGHVDRVEIAGERLRHPFVGG